MSERSYVCENCKGEFDKTWPDEAAELEALELFGIDPAANPGALAVVCDDCFQQIMKPVDHTEST